MSLLDYAQMLRQHGGMQDANDVSGTFKIVSLVLFVLFIIHSSEPEASDTPLHFQA
jgi:hypothetical protein